MEIMVDRTLVNLRQCWYCKHAVFDREHVDTTAQGLCKFKK